jgi:tetratricopeptide (TPR) repeat protein
MFGVDYIADWPGCYNHGDTGVKKNRQVARERQAEPQAAPRSYKKYALPAVLLAALLAAYWTSFDGQFLVDNAEMVRDSRIHSATSEHVHRILTERYWEGMGDQLYRPVATLTYLFNYAVLGNGTAPAGYHWFNLVVHALNMLLVYWLGLAVFEDEVAAAALSGLWGLHPVLTESVTNVIGRSDMLAAFGVLAALMAHRKALASAGGRRAAWLAGVAGASAIGVFSKESGIVAVAVLVLWDLAFGGAFGDESGWGRRAASYAAAVAPGLLFLAARANALSGQAYQPPRFVDNPLTGVDFLMARFTAVKAIGRYLVLLAWPAKLSPDYSYNEIPLSGFGDWKAWLALAVCLGAAAWAARSWRRAPAVLFFVGLFFVALAPVSNVFLLIGTIFGERLVYLPAVGVVGCVVWGLREIERRNPGRRTAVRVAVAVVAVAFVARTSARNVDWHDADRFWKSARDAAPGSYKTVLEAALSGPLAGEDLARSVREVEQALSILEGLPDARNAPFPYQQAGTLYRHVGESVAAGKAVAALSARGAAFWYGKSLEALQRCERIEAAQDEVARRENAARGLKAETSGRGAAARELARTYLKVGDVGAAIAAYERGRQVSADPELLEELGAAYRSRGESRKAAQALVEALSLDGSRGQLMPMLVELYAAADPGGCAVQQGQLNVQCPLVHEDVCRASGNVIGVYRRRGQTREAEALRQTAVGELGCGELK